MADPTLPQGEVRPRLPVELCEHVIDAVYEDAYFLLPTALATLSRCALVCRAWRFPAQKVLFHFVILRDKDALYRFAELLDATPELGAYVRRVQLRGYLHIPNSSVVSFPAVIGARLMNLSELHIFELPDVEKDSTPLPDGVQEFPALPFRRLYLPSLASISRIRTLDLYKIVFPSFGDFARILHTLHNLQQLYCQRVSWVVLGQEPLCMVKRRFRGSEQVFLSNLERFRCTNMDERGRQRLLGALGPSLRELSLSLPSNPTSARTQPSAVEETNPSGAVNLQSFPDLELLLFYITAAPQPYHRALAALPDTLLSWVTSDRSEWGTAQASQPRRVFCVEPHRPSFSREEFLQLLHVIGLIVEAELCSEAYTPDPETAAGGNIESQVDPCWATVAVQNLGDTVEWVDWWETRVQECFPTFTKWSRLEVYPCDDRDPTIKWKDYEQTPDNFPQTSSPALPSMTAEGYAYAM